MIAALRVTLMTGVDHPEDERRLSMQPEKRQNSDNPRESIPEFTHHSTSTVFPFCMMHSYMFYFYEYKEAG